MAGGTDRGVSRRMAQRERFTTTADDCTFCRIVRREVDAQIVYEDETTLTFLDHRPLLLGHCLTIPKMHVETFGELPGELIERYFSVVQKIAIAVERGLGAEGSFVAINNRISQSVPHLHTHVVPRRKKDGLFSTGLIWKRKSYASVEESDSIRNAIIQAIADMSQESNNP